MVFSEQLPLTEREHGIVLTAIAQARKGKGVRVSPKPDEPVDMKRVAQALHDAGYNISDSLESDSEIPGAVRFRARPYDAEAGGPSQGTPLDGVGGFESFFEDLFGGGIKR